ncbi:sequence-specific DNA binding transcription factor [Parasponia andersonii]|uniref:Sequence-specific DNA binding transcription factor n=1 Tax=Parasponia andersonii TaxID=3476 RepID=A0A2P5C4X0_PARAD|nr:sequence-specific DNA binding transcription factor [Parasponia andersonii]
MGGGMLGLELPLQQQQNPSNPPNPHHLSHPQMVAYAHHEPDHHPQAQPSVKHGYPFAPKLKPVLALSDEDEPGFAADDTSGDGKRKMSPWQRMKWTDTMVKLLIMAVFYIGDENGSEGTDPTTKKKHPGGLLQKKGKWKSVSRAMMEKGFYVSPQQCEDKFNDLNKRYKRVNDILGKGTACRVVENQSLLDTMDLTPKMKEEVRKLLNSKHLFFREMCAYHNSCGHGSVSTTGGASGAHHSPELASSEPSSHVQPNQQNQQQRCLHSTDNSHVDYDDDEDDEEAEGGSRGHIGHGHGDIEDESYEGPHKRPRKGALSESSQLMQQLSCEILGVIQDGSKSSWEKKHWLKTRLIQLEEQQVGFQCEAFELEKQRLKWVKFSGKKEREMERAKFENEKRRLENERMVLLIRQKELEVLDLHHRSQHQQQQHSSNKRGGEPSSITG